jgi:hypothetical protein
VELKTGNVIFLALICLVIGAVGLYFLERQIAGPDSVVINLTDSEKAEITKQQKDICDASTKMATMNACKSDLRDCKERNKDMADSITELRMQFNVDLRDVNKSIAKAFTDLNKSIYDVNKSLSDKNCWR